MEKKFYKICYVVTIPLTIRAFFIPQLKHLSGKGFDVTVICCEDDNLQSELGEHITYIPVDMPRGFALKESVKAVKTLTKIFEKEKYDLVQYSTPNAAMYASIAAKRAGIKIRNYHLMGFRYLGEKGIKRFFLKCLEKFTCKISTSIECVSKSNLELGIKEKVLKKDKAVVVWNGSSGGVDVERFNYGKRPQWRKEIREKLGYDDTDFVFGFVGRITKDKGIDELLEAFFLIDNGSKLLLVGNIENECGLKQKLLLMARQSSDIQFHESVSDVEKYYAAIDVLVLPSYREGFGNVVIEAGAVGTPVIISDIPGPIDTIEEGNTGLIAPVKNVRVLAKKMLEIQSINYREMGENAVEFVREHFECERLNNAICYRKKQLLIEKKNVQ